jgi:hypothetical protein
LVHGVVRHARRCSGEATGAAAGRRVSPAARLARTALLGPLFLLSTCRLDELTSPGELGRIDVIELSHLDSARLGSTATRARTQTLTIIGSSASLPYSASIQGASPWISLSSTNGSAPGTLTLTLDPEGLALGEHKDTVLFTAGFADAIPVKVGVTFNIIGCREELLGALPVSVTGAITAEDCASPRSPGRFARLFRFTGAANDSISLAATSSAFAPSVAIGPAVAGQAPLGESNDCAVGAADGNACLRYVRLPAAGAYLIEVTSVAAGVTGAHGLTVGGPRAPDAPATLVQETADGPTLVVAVGASVPSPRVRIRASLADADLDSMRLEVELRPASQPFTGVATGTSAWGNGPSFSVEQAGLSDDEGYRWRARAVDPTGRASSWVEFGGNATDADDFSVAVADAPAAPVSLVQLRADGTTPIASGGTTNESLAVLRATVSDPDPGDQLRLDVEVRPVGTAFTGVASASSALVAPGAVASVTFAGLADAVGYRWRARTVDGAGRASAWVTFGTSAAADFSAALPPTQLAFTVQPTAAAAGAIITPAVRIAAQGPSGATRTSYNGPITISLGTSGGGSLSGTTTVAAVDGVAMFSDLSVNVAGAYTLVATVGALQVTSGAFDVGAGSGQALVFVGGPTNGTAGAALVPAPQVRVQDALGNVASGFTGDVTLALALNAEGATLAGATTVAAVAGVATFSNVRIERAGSGYAFAASGTALAGAQGGSVDIAPAAATTLELVTAPAATAASGAALATQPALRLRDAFGNAVSVAGTLVSASLSSGPGGATLANATTTTDAAGVATFSGLAITGGGGAYTLAFAASGLTGASSSSITLGAGAASRLAVVTEPSATARNGDLLGTQPSVRLLDGPGNTVASAGVAVTVSIASGGGTLGGTTTVLTGADGVATFAELSITGTVGARTLRFHADGLIAANSALVTLSAGDAMHITRNSANGQIAQAGANAPVAPAVLVQDVSGNAVAGVPVTFTATSGGGTVNPATPVVTGANGVAALTSWTLGATAGVNLVEASATGLVGSPVTFGATGTAGTAAGLVIAGGDDLTGPMGTTLGTAHEVRVVDANDNPVAGVSVAWAALGGGSANPAISVSGADGIASTIRRLGPTAGPQGTTATATIAGAPVVVTFSITATVGGPSQLSLVSGDGQAGTVGTALPQPLAVLVRDTGGNPVSGVLITWSIVDGGGSLAPTTSLTDASGVATTAWTLGTVTTPTDSTQLARATGVGSPVNFIATSRAGAVSATQTLVTVDPASVGASRTAPVTVTVTARDAFANPVPNQGVVLTASGTGNTLVQPAAVTNASGIATGSFGSTTTGAHVLSATVNALPAVQQPTVTVVPAPAARLAFVTSPSDVTSGASIAPAIMVELLDSLGNRATTATGTVTLSFAANPGTATLGGTVARAAVAGVATFPDISVNRAAAGYQLGASSGTLTGVVSPAFEVRTGTVSATRSLVAVAPGSVAAGVSSVVTVTARDLNDNPVAGAVVTLAASGAGNTIDQPLGVTDANGIATGAVSSTVAGLKSVTATIAGVDVTQAASLTVTPATVSATVSEIVASPGAVSADGGTATITVTARDAFGNPIPGATVVLAASGTLNSLGQPVALTNANGATTGSLASTRAEVKTVSATINGVALTSTASVTVGVGAVSAARSSVLSSTGSLVAGADAATITVTARDANDNPVAGVAVVLAASGTANTLVQPVVVTNASGVATGTLASTRAEQKTVTATAGGVSVSQAALVTVAPAVVSAAQSEVTATPTSVASGEASLVTVTARDAFDNPVAGAAVVLAASGTGNTIEQPAPTSATGVTTGTVSSSVAEQKSVTATINGVAVTQAATVTVTAGTVSAATSTVSAAPGTLAAGSSTSTITVTARDDSGNPVAGVAVVLAATGTDNVVVQPAPTGPDGVTTGTISSTRAGTKSVSATIAGVAVTQVADVVVTPAALSPTASTVQLSTNVISAGAGSAAITVTARDEFLNPISGATVVLAATGDGNAITQPAAVTDAAGVASGAISSTVSEAKTITATVDGVLLVQSPVVTVTPDAADAAQSTLELAAATIAAGEDVTVTVTARDASGNVIPGVTVGILATGGGNTVTAPASLTDANGVATGSFRSTLAEGKTISATVNGVTLAQTSALTVIPAAISGAQSAVVASAGSIVAGTESSNITVTVRDEFLNPVPNATVVLSSAGGALVQPAAVTDASGVATGSFSSAATGSFSVSAIANGTAITQVAPVSVTPGAISSALSTVTADPITLVAGSAAAITVTARDANGNLVPGATVLLASTGTDNMVGSPGAVTDASGVATGSFASTRAEAKVVTATINGVAVTTGAAITVTPDVVNGAQSTIALSTGTVAAGGTVDVTVTARDVSGNVVPGATVVLAVSGTGVAVTQPLGTTSALGVATGSFVPTLAELKTVSATINGVTVTLSPTVTVTPAGVSADGSTVAVDPASIVAASGSSTITVTVRDSFGNAIAGATVTLAASGDGNTITASPPATDANGVTSGTLSSTAAGAKTVTATANGTSLSTQPVVTVTAGTVNAGMSSVEVSAATTVANVPITVTVTARDASGNPIAGVPVAVSVSGTGNSVTDPVPDTDANGVSVVTFSSTQAASKTISATAGGTPITQQQVVAVTPGAASTATSTLGAAPTTISAVTGSATLTVTVLDAFSNPVPGVTVEFAATGTGNTLTPSAVSDANGVATGTLQSTVSEAKTVTATIGGEALAQSPVVTVTPDAADGALSSLQLSTATAAAGEQVTVTVTARDAGGNPVAGVTVNLTANGAGTSFTQPPVTDANGVAIGFFTSTVAEEKTISATVNGTPVTQTGVLAVSPAAVSTALSTIIADPTILVAGSATSTITVTALDAFSNPIPGLAVVLAVNGTGNSLTQPAAVTDAAGVATGALSSTVSEVKSVTATVGGITIDQAATVTVGASAVSAANSLVDVSSATATAGTSVTVTVTARDANDNPVAGVAVVVTADGLASSNTITGPLDVTDANGQATATFSSTRAEARIVSATVNGAAVTQTAGVTFSPAAVSTSVSTIVPATPGIIAGGAPIDITVMALDAFGNPVADAVVVLFAAGTGDQLTQPAATTDANGVATGTFTSTGSGPKTVTATIGGNALTPTATIAVSPAAIDAAHSIFTAAPATIAAGSGSSTLTVTARDQFDNPVPDAAVVFAASPDAGTTVTQPAGLTNATGVASGSLSATSLGTRTVTATAGGVPLSTSHDVVVTPDVADPSNTAIVLSAETALAGEAVTVTVTARDANGHLVSGAAVVLGSSSQGTQVASPNTGTTDGNGVFTTTVTSTFVQAAATVTGSINGQPIGNADSFEVTPGSAASFGFVNLAASAVAGAPITPGVEVHALDQFGNVDTSFTGTIAISIQPGTGTDLAALVPGSTVELAAVGGLATFTNLAIDSAGTGYALLASSGSLSSSSGPFSITPGAATTIVFTTQPATSTLGTLVGPPVVVVVRDALGNTVTSYSGQVTLTVVGGNGLGVLLGGGPVEAQAGVASFNALGILLPADGYQLQASAVGVPGTFLSAPFDITILESLAAVSFLDTTPARRAILGLER